MGFAESALENSKEDESKQMVLLEIFMQNENCQHYVSLDREEYTCYPDEKEILL
mgnify:CR=1 FL=1